MKAFTHFCRRINISIMKDTITVYERDKKWFGNMRKAMRFLQQAPNGDKYRFVYKDQKDHRLYHKDHFERKKRHFHLQFNDSIDEVKFASILALFIANDLISLEEKDRLIVAYDQANVLVRERITYTKEETKIKTHLFYLEEKISAMEAEADKHPSKDKTASITARALHNSVSQAMNTYLRNRSPEAYSRLSNACYDLITDAKPTLVHQRLIPCLFFKTDLEKQVDKVAKALNQIKSDREPDEKDCLLSKNHLINDKF